jgi:ketosteroid isomerase-like protein
MWIAVGAFVLAAIGGIANLTLLRRQAPADASPLQPVAQEAASAAPVTPAIAPVVAPPEREPGSASATRTPPPVARDAPRESAAPAPPASTAVAPPLLAPPSPVPAASSVAPQVVTTPAAPAEPRPAPAETLSAAAPPPPVAVPAEAAAVAAIEDVVARYRAALESRDIGGLKRIWPGLAGRQEDAIRTEFQNARAISAAIDGLTVQVTGGTATAISRRNYQVTTTDGRTLRTATRMTMTLTRRDGGWTIDAIRHETTP